MGVTSADGKHEYQRCTDDNCPRFPCQVYKQGVSAGWAAGHARGHAEGVELGYKLGFPDGIAACPRPHGKG
jgi:hypothetical protein